MLNSAWRLTPSWLQSWQGHESLILCRPTRPFAPSGLDNQWTMRIPLGLYFHHILLLSRKVRVSKVRFIVWLKSTCNCLLINWICSLTTSPSPLPHDIAERRRLATPTSPPFSSSAVFAISLPVRFHSAAAVVVAASLGEGVEVTDSVDQKVGDRTFKIMTGIFFDLLALIIWLCFFVLFFSTPT